MTNKSTAPSKAPHAGFGFLIFVIGSLFMMLPVIIALPPYVALEIVTTGSVCVLAIVVWFLGPRVRELVKLLRVMPHPQEAS